MKNPVDRNNRRPDFPREAVQRALREEGVDGWLFYFFQGNDPLALRLLKIPPDRFFSRRWFYFVPARGTPVKIVHRIEPGALDGLPGRAHFYGAWEELGAHLAHTVKGRRIAMQYSPKGAVPTLSRVDGGTLEWVRSLGGRVVSSGDLVQHFDAVLTPRQRRQQEITARDLHELVREAFGFIARAVRTRGRTREREVQSFLRRGYARRGWVTNADPIVAVNRHSASPHYAPGPGRDAPLRKGDWVLLDVWAKPRGEDAIYADITWCGFVGAVVPERYERVFQVVRRARDAAVSFIAQRGQENRSVQGWEVDRAARREVERAGLGKYFLHRTGHSIGTEDHAAGANMDGLETRETRRLLPGTLFSIEPGIYLPTFGARSEINVRMDGPRPLITGGPPQESVVRIL